MNILVESARTETVVKNSRFIAEVFPVTTQAEAREKLKELKETYRDATHVVHAFIAGLQGETSGLSDDGEPSGTAGRPVYEVLKGSGITNILLTVTRYFGGTLLGTGGLVRAYSDAAKQVLAAAHSEPYVARSSFSFTCPYSVHEGILRLFTNYTITDVKQEYGADVQVSGRIITEQTEAFAQSIKDMTKGKMEVSFTPCI